MGFNFPYPLALDLLSLRFFRCLLVFCILFLLQCPGLEESLLDSEESEDEDEDDDEGSIESELLEDWSKPDLLSSDEGECAF